MFGNTATFFFPLFAPDLGNKYVKPFLFLSFRGEVCCFAFVHIFKEQNSVANNLAKAGCSRAIDM